MRNERGKEFLKRWHQLIFKVFRRVGAWWGEQHTMKSHPKLLGLSLCSCRPAVAFQRHQQLQQEGQQASSSSGWSPRRRCRSPPRWTCQSSCQRRPARSLRGRRACCSTWRARPPAGRARGAAALFDVAPASSLISGGVHRVADKPVKTVAQDWNWMLTRKIEKADTFSWKSTYQCKCIFLLL